MSKLKNTLKKWAEEAARHVCACQKPDSELMQEKKAIAAKALECFLQMPDTEFDPSPRKGLFGEKISLWREMGTADFCKRVRPASCTGLSHDFHCDVNRLDVTRILLYNGSLSGPRGVNQLDPTRPATLGRYPCICRVSDLESTGENHTKLIPFLEEARKGLCRKEKGNKVMETADFAKGGRESGLEPFKWLNRALSEETLLIYIPAGYTMEKPLQVVNLHQSEKPAFVQAQFWVLLEEGASMSLVQCTDSHPLTDSVVNVLSEIRIGNNARLEHIQLQNVGDRCKLFHNLNVQQEADSVFRSYNLNLNGGMTRSNLEVNLNRPRARAELLGLYLEDHEQKISHTVKVNHWAEETYSRELFKGVMDDSSSAFFEGHVFVSPQAQKTEAYQSCRNLLISPKAQAHAKPYLEIYADDVQCNHGVTVGQLDEDALFYMRSRGIPTGLARRLLMRAYADEILSSISVESIRNWMVFLVKKRFSGQLQACEQCVLSCSEKSCFPEE